MKEELPGFCVGPMVVEIPKDRIYHEESFCQLELFAPVVHVIGFDTLEEALDIYNSVEYGLTGGVYSQSQDDIDYLMARVENGNVYVNRGITGARVGVEPFGGFKMSGTGPKAGSRLYVPAFHVVPNRQLVKKATARNISAQQAMAFDGLAWPNGQSLEKRLKILENAWDILSCELKSKMQSISDPEIYTKRIDEFVTCSRTMLSEFLYQPHPNRDIPGQESYDDYSMIKENTVMISQEGVPDLPVMLNVLSALVTGSGLTILALSEESHVFWVHMLSVPGLPGRSVKLYKANHQTLQSALDEPFIQNIILDVPKEELPGILQWIYPEKFHEKRTRHLLTVWDAPMANVPGDYLVQFLNVRSMAINNMRYGAPLELDLDG